MENDVRGHKFNLRFKVVVKQNRSKGSEKIQFISRHTVLKYVVFLLSFQKSDPKLVCIPYVNLDHKALRDYPKRQ